MLKCILAIAICNHVAANKYYPLSIPCGYELIGVGNAVETSAKHDLIVKHTITWQSNIPKLSYYSTTPQIILFKPGNSSDLLNVLKTVIRIYNQNENNIWKPITYIELPNLIRSDTETYIQNVLSNTFKMFKGRLLVDSEVFIIVDTMHEGIQEYQLYEIFTLGASLIIQRKFVAMDDFFYVSKLKGVSVRRENFHQSLITAVGFAGYRYELTWEINTEGDVELTNSLSANVFRDLQYSLNFRIYEANKRKGDQGIWPEMQRTLKNGKADIGINVFFVLGYRLDYHDFLHPFYIINIEAFFRQPEGTKARNLFLSAFKFQNWATYGFIWTTLYFATLFMNWIRKKFLQHIVDTTEDSVQASSFWTASMICQQGWYNAPPQTSMRIVLFIGSLVGFLCYTIYGAALVSILAVEVIHIKTLQELGESDLGLIGDADIPFISRRVEQVEYYRPNSSSVKSKNGHLLYKMEDAIPELLKGNSAFLSFGDSLRDGLIASNPTFTDADFCSKLYSIPLPGSQYYCTYSLKKSSEYREIFNQKILKINERGLTHRNVKMSTPVRITQCQLLKTGIERTLELKEFFTPFLIFICGILLSIVLFLLEISITRRQQININTNRIC